MPKALQIGDDLLLMQTRAGLLTEAGFEVLNLVGLAGTLDEIPSLQWDAAILCHTLSRSDCGKVMAALRRRNPRARILLVGRRADTTAAESRGFDVVLSPAPARMIAALQEIVQQIVSRQEEPHDATEVVG